MRISQRIRQICPSPTLAITAKTKQLRDQGVDVIGFGAGEPDFDTPDHIKNAAKQALDEGFTRYTPASGIAELKEAICQKFQKDNRLVYSPEEVLVSCGAKHSIFNALLTLCDDGDEVIIPAPYWVSYPEMVKAAGGKPVIVKTDPKTHFKITPDQLERSLSSKTKLIILNSPSNPTGMLYQKQDLQALADILVHKGVFCLSDEIYEKLIYDAETHISIASLNQEIKNQTIVINGVSKAYSMTGWRIGYAAGPKDIIQAMSHLQSQSTSNPTSIAQKGALAALKGPQDFIPMAVKAFVERRDYMVKRLNAIKGISCLNPQGAFYVFPNISEICGQHMDGHLIKDSFSFTEILLQKANVAVVPGAAFGAEGFIRLSYATSMENITKGLDRLEQFCAAI